MKLTHKNKPILKMQPNSCSYCYPSFCLQHHYFHSPDVHPFLLQVFARSCLQKSIQLCLISSVVLQSAISSCTSSISFSLKPCILLFIASHIQLFLWVLSPFTQFGIQTSQSEQYRLIATLLLVLIMIYFLQSR